MKDFVLAALPWVLAGLAVAILCAKGSRRKSSATEQRIALGMSLGLLLGLALNGCGLWESHAIGLALGPLWGMTLAMLLPEKPHDDEPDHKS